MACSAQGGRVRLGIVGHAQDKFTPRTEALAREAIAEIIALLEPSAIVSGHCPLGGVDWYAEDAAADAMLPMIVHAPTSFSWTGVGGYKARNLRITHDSDVVVCVAVAHLPPGFTGMQFDACYHCHGRNPPHVKGGGCWTAWKCARREWVIIK